jgi:hypothetical protein
MGPIRTEGEPKKIKILNFIIHTNIKILLRDY